MIKAVIFDMYETLITLFESPPYFGPQIADGLDIDKSAFLTVWNELQQERTIGKVTFEKVLALIMHKNQSFNNNLLKHVVEKRIAVKRESFHHLHPEILTMLSELKKKNIGIVIQEKVQ